MVILGAGSVLLAVVVGLNQLSPSKPNDDGPPRSNELCASLRDPLNDQLTKGDWERLTDWSESTLQRYVLDQCPDQYYRVD